MPQKKKVTRSRAKSKVKKVKFGNRTLSLKLLIYIAVFAVVGGYFLIKSFAASTAVLTSINLDATNSVKATSVTETASKSKRNSSVVQLANTSTSIDAKATLASTNIALDTGVYKVCLRAFVPSGSVSGGVLIAKYANGKTGTVLGGSVYDLTSTTDYKDAVCFSITNETSNTVVSAVVTNGTKSGIIRIGNVNFTRTGSIPTPPPPPPPPPGDPKPVGTPANIKTWSLKFSDEFNGTSLDRNKWADCWWSSANCSGSMNNVKPQPSNVSVKDGNVILTLSDSNNGALIASSKVVGAGVGYEFQYGYAEARVFFPGNGSKCYNWPAWWLDGYPHPAGGENDIAEVLSGGDMTVNYHSPSGSHNQGNVPGYWCDGFHVYGAYRQPGKVDVYFDGNKVKSYATDDNGATEYLLFNVGKTSGSYSAYGSASQVKIDYARVWQ